MSATNFSTKNDTYRKLMGNGLTYRIPRFQRDYSWGEDEWDDLWQDILGTVKEKGEPAHYMGYLVLQSTDDKVFDVIDGQQRLTTLSLFVLAALKQLKRLIAEGHEPEKTKQRLEGLRQTYVGYLDPVTLVPRSKLTLNRNNDTYYQTYIVPLSDTLPQRGFKATEHNLRKAFEWFDRRVAEYSKSSKDPGVAVAQLVDRMSDRLFFTVITVTDELNAYKVFETLNARGVRLSATDLLKNFLFSVLHRSGQHENELRALDDRWENIVSRLGAESFPDFLRVHWLSRKSFVRQTDLFKTIRSSIVGRAEVFDLLSGMEEDMDAYLALASPEASSWQSGPKNNARLLKTFNVRQPFPLLIAAKRALSAGDFETLMRAIVVISFRYNVIGNFQTSEQERTYFAAADKVSKGAFKKAQDVLDGLYNVYPHDKTFKEQFAEKAIGTSQARNRRVVKYILCELEKQASGTDLDFESDTLSIEHICPLNPNGGWDHFSDEEIEAFSQRLGNMTLMPAGQNRDLGNSRFTEKKPTYSESQYQMTRDVASLNEEWTPSKIAARQNAMAAMATSIWRISQLS